MPGAWRRRGGECRGKAAPAEGDGEAGGCWDIEMYGRGRGSLVVEEAESASTGMRRC